MGLLGSAQTKALSKKCQKSTFSKHIEAYTQKGRKRHFELNGSGLESQFDCLQKVAFRTKIRRTIKHLNKIFKYKIDKYAGCYRLPSLKKLRPRNI